MLGLAWPSVPALPCHVKHGKDKQAVVMYSLHILSSDTRSLFGHGSNKQDPASPASLDLKVWVRRWLDPYKVQLVLGEYIVCRAGGVMYTRL